MKKEKQKDEFFSNARPLSERWADESAEEFFESLVYIPEDSEDYKNYVDEGED